MRLAILCAIKDGRRQQGSIKKVGQRVEQPVEAGWRRDYDGMGEISKIREIDASWQHRDLQGCEDVANTGQAEKEAKTPCVSASRMHGDRSAGQPRRQQ